jgi:hypothetical protein
MVILRCNWELSEDCYEIILVISYTTAINPTIKTGSQPPERNVPYLKQVLSCP